jgi:hypothetical protein
LIKKVAPASHLMEIIKVIFYHLVLEWWFQGFLLQFCDVAMPHLRPSSMREISQIWLQVREKTRKFWRILSLYFAHLLKLIF